MNQMRVLILSLACGLSAVSGVQAQRFDGVTLQMNGYGGATDEAIAEGVGKPLLARHGIRLVITPGSGSADLARAIATRSNPSFDVMNVDSPLMPEGIRAGLFEEATEADVPSLAEAQPGTRSFGNFCVPWHYNSVLIAYHPDRVRTPPVSYGDLARPDLRDRLTLYPPSTTSGVLLMLAIAKANGGGPDNIDPAFVALRSMRANIATVPASDVAMYNLLLQNEVDVGMVWLSRMALWQSQNQPFRYVVPREGLVGLVTYACAIKGSRHAEAVKLVLREITSADAQAVMATKNRLPFSNVNARSRMPAELAAQIPSVDNVSFPGRAEWEVVASRRSGWIERWNREIAR